MTLHEWRWTDGWAVHPVGLRSVVGSSRSDFVLDGVPRAIAWIQVDRSLRRLAVLADEHTDVCLGDLITYGLIRLGPGGPALCAVRDYQSGLAAALEESSFQVSREETLFARGLAARVPELKLVPIRAS
jgi:hypothetical protein